MKASLYINLSAEIRGGQVCDKQLNCARLLGVTLYTRCHTIYQVSHYITNFNGTQTKPSQKRRIAFTIYFVTPQPCAANPHNFVNIYTSLVRSMVEYICRVWHTSLTSTMLNCKIQKTYIFYIYSMHFTTNVRASMVCFLLVNNKVLVIFLY